MKTLSAALVLASVTALNLNNVDSSDTDAVAALLDELVHNPDAHVVSTDDIVAVIDDQEIDDAIILNSAASSVAYPSNPYATQSPAQQTQTATGTNLQYNPYAAPAPMQAGPQTFGRPMGMGAPSSMGLSPMAAGFGARSPMGPSPQMSAYGAGPSTYGSGNWAAP